MRMSTDFRSADIDSTVTLDCDPAVDTAGRFIHRWGIASVGVLDEEIGR